MSCEATHSGRAPDRDAGRLRVAEFRQASRRQRDPVEIKGKKAVVVGGASGMARAAAEMLHDRGASVAILDRAAEDVHKVGG